MRFTPASAGWRERPAFTLIELLVVFAIVLVVSALAVAAIQRVRDAALRVACGNNLRQIGVAMQGYHDGHGSLPPGMSRRQGLMPYLSWCARILPQLNEQALWDVTVRAFAQTAWFADAPPHVGLAKPMRIFMCSSEVQEFGSALPEITKTAITSYFGVTGHRGSDGLLFSESSVNFAQVSDGLSSTLLVGERGMSVDGNGEFRFGWWYGGIGQVWDGSLDYLLSVRQTRATYRTPTCPKGPYHFQPGRQDNPCDLFHHWSYHLDGANFLFADGAVKYLAYSADSVLPALATRAGGETAQAP